MLYSVLFGQLCRSRNIIPSKIYMIHAFQHFEKGTSGSVATHHAVSVQRTDVCRTEHTYLLQRTCQQSLQHPGLYQARKRRRRRCGKARAVNRESPDPERACFKMYTLLQRIEIGGGLNVRGCNALLLVALCCCARVRTIATLALQD